MNVTLINPPEKLRVWAGISESMSYGVYCFPPLGLMYLQASLEKRTHHQAEIYDAVVDDMDHPEFAKGLDKYDLDVVGISCYTHSLPDVQVVINEVRKRNPNAHITLGGPHPIMFPEYAIGLTGVDSICTGDGDDVIIDLVNALDEGKSLEGIAGLWFKDADGTIVKTAARKELRDISWQTWPTTAAPATATTGSPAPSSPSSPRPSPAAAAHLLPLLLHVPAVPDAADRQHPRRDGARISWASPSASSWTTCSRRTPNGPCASATASRARPRSTGATRPPSPAPPASRSAGARRWGRRSAQA